MVALHEAVGIGVDWPRGLDLLAAMPDVDRAAFLRRVVAQDHGFADERSVDLVEHAIEAAGAIACDAALLLEEEELAQVELGPGNADIGRPHRPRVERRL